MSNVLNGLGVLRFNKAAGTYLDINPVAYMNQITACVPSRSAAPVSYFFCLPQLRHISRCSPVRHRAVQRAVRPFSVQNKRTAMFCSQTLRNIIADSANGLRIFFDGNHWCVQATQGSGVGCSTRAGDGGYHVVALLFDGNAVGDAARTTFRFDTVALPLTFASSQSSITGT